MSFLASVIYAEQETVTKENFSYYLYYPYDWLGETGGMQNR